jgi:8-oxo-dGTP pyrophosphatase MutT (NUDIX family)
LSKCHKWILILFKFNQKKLFDVIPFNNFIRFLFKINILHFKEFTEILRDNLSKPLPGSKAHKLALPSSRKATDVSKLDQALVKKAAVLALLENHNNEPHVVLTLRTTYKGTHSGQVSFPGGKREEQDADFLSTALRETEEEIGINKNDIDVIGSLSPIYIPPSNFLVYPFVGVSHKVLRKRPEEKEVHSIHSIPLSALFADETLAEISIMHTSGSSIKVPSFNINGLEIWGATAMMLAELKQVVPLSAS